MAIDEDDADVPASATENRPEKFTYIFDRILADSDFDVPAGYLVDCLGVLTDARFLAAAGIDPNAIASGRRQVKVPTLQTEQGHNEGWFEVVDWFVSAQEARDRFVMISLGASYGAQAVGAYKALQMVNPLPAKLVAVEADPEGPSWIRQHFRDNGISPDDHWIVQAAVSDTNEPVLFPVGALALGASNCVSTNEPKGRDTWIALIRRDGDPMATVENLIRYGSTGLLHDVGGGFRGEVKFVSAVTLADLVANFDKIDLLECDIQQSEIVVVPPFINLLRRKVRRIHIGTHGAEVHRTLHRLFATTGWEIVFNYRPNATHESVLGSFATNDGILTVRNPDL